MTKLKLQVELPAYTYEHSLESIAVESAFVNNATDLAKRFLPALADKFKSLSGLFSTDKEKIKPLSKNLVILIDTIIKKSYVELKDIEITTPENYNYNLYEAFVMTQSSVEVMTSIHVDQIKKFKAFLSSFITNKDFKINTKDITHLAAAIVDNTKKLNSNLKEIFNLKDHRASSSFSKLFHNMDQVEKTIRLYPNLKYSFDAVEISKIKKDIDDISDLLDVLIGQLEKDRIENISPENLRNISTCIDALANSAESIAVSYFKLISIVNIVSELEKTIK